MEVTKDWLVKNYNLYRKSIFQNKLPQIGSNYNGKLRFDIKVGHSKKTLGTFRVNILRLLDIATYTITLTNYYDRSEEDVINTLVHEMIHCYISYNGYVDNASHGTIFCDIAKQINSTFNLNIEVKGRADISSIRNKNGKEYYILATEMKNGTCYISSLNNKHKYIISNCMRSLHSIASVKLFKTNDIQFDNYPKFRTCKGIKKSKRNFDEIVSNLEKNAIRMQIPTIH